MEIRNYYLPNKEAIIVYSQFWITFNTDTKDLNILSKNTFFI